MTPRVGVPFWVDAEGRDRQGRPVTLPHAPGTPAYGVAGPGWYVLVRPEEGGDSEPFGPYRDRLDAILAALDG